MFKKARESGRELGHQPVCLHASGGACALTIRLCVFCVRSYRALGRGDALAHAEPPGWIRLGGGKVSSSTPTEPVRHSSLLHRPAAFLGDHGVRGPGAGKAGQTMGSVNFVQGRV